MDPDTIGVVEAHGTGTPVGDPMSSRPGPEYGNAGSRCCSDRPRANLGHTESAAGAVGLIKAILDCNTAWCRRWCTSPGCPMRLRNRDRTDGAEGGTPGQRTTAAPEADRGRPRRDLRNQRARHPGAGPAGRAPEALQLEPRRRPDAVPLALTSATNCDAARRLRRLRVGRAPDSVVLARTWPTPWPAGVGTGPVRTAVIAATSGAGRGLREIAAGDEQYPHQAASGTGVRTGVGILRARVRSGPRWAQTCFATEPVFAEVSRAAEPVIARSPDLGDRGDDGAADRDRHRPDAADTVRHAGRAGQPPWKRTGCARRGHRASLGEAAAAVIAGALSTGRRGAVICRRSRLILASPVPARGVGRTARQEVSGSSWPAVSTMSRLGDRLVAIDGVTGAIADEQDRDLVAAWEKRDVMAREWPSTWRSH